jgi:hypothetical protein
LAFHLVLASDGILRGDEGDAAGIVYAVDKNWLLVERDHSVCLTEAGRRLVEERCCGPGAG